MSIKAQEMRRRLQEARVARLGNLVDEPGHSNDGNDGVPGNAGKGVVRAPNVRP
jgi:hypothetical protein